MPTFITPGPIAATIEVGGAQVRVTASDRPDTVVEVRPLHTDSKSVKVAEKTKVEFDRGQLSVKTTTAGDKSGSVAITIEVPAGSSVAAYLAYSNVQVVGPVGQCELHMASGRIEVDSMDALRASIASGDVVIGHIAGGATIDGSAFSLRIGEVNGTVGLSNSGGQTWIGHAAADLDLSSARSDFDIDRADGSVTAETASGVIRIGRMTSGRARLTNGSGNIEVGITEGVAASVDVNSERGAVHNFVSSAQAEASAATVSVFARTRHGDITIHRAAS